MVLLVITIVTMLEDDGGVDDDTDAVYQARGTCWEGTCIISFSPNRKVVTVLPSLW